MQPREGERLQQHMYTSKVLQKRRERERLFLVGNGRKKEER